MSKNNKFSLSMCVYYKDDPEWFQTAVNSVLNQTVKPDEVVLVVDGPVPNSLDKIICEYEKIENFKVIRLPENRGHGEARRVGLENCSYEIVALMDADDVCMPDRFEQELTFFEKNNVDIVGGDIAEFIGDIENIVSYRTVPTSNAEIKRYMKKRCPFNQMTVMFKKSRVEKAGGYLDWYCNEDYYLWLRMLLTNCSMANTGTVLVYARIGQEMYQRRGGWIYFRSEAKLQRFMLKNHIIDRQIYMINIMKRLVVQVLLPNSIRGWVFQHFAREKA